ncbi:unnamed protein product [Notodromas monacha]|uniref:Uncharacterized protein n=1 Tax=Notodromas monacha TaxID=399045 RepID=A0A7R9GCJ3_9CRUS|nr:unnamed protein product [Notodromas monacha]CAG0917496.1 unnamed protein product [Notodromas monacha]
MGDVTRSSSSAESAHDQYELNGEQGNPAQMGSHQRTLATVSSSESSLMLQFRAKKDNNCCKNTGGAERSGAETFVWENGQFCEFLSHGGGHIPCLVFTQVRRTEPGVLEIFLCFVWPLVCVWIRMRARVDVGADVESGELGPNGVHDNKGSVQDDGASASSFKTARE